MMEADNDRLERLIKASWAGVHAYQALLASRREEDYPDFQVTGTEEYLEDLVSAHGRLLTSPAEELTAWTAAEAEDFSSSSALWRLEDWEPDFGEALPVKVAERFFLGMAAKSGLSSEHAGALVNMLQVTLEVERDGDTLQDMLAFYRDLGILAGPSDFDIPDDNDAFLEIAEELAANTCEVPFPADANAWQMALRKVQNWSRKCRGIGPKEYAEEVMKRPEAAESLEKLKTMPETLVAVIGHSYTGLINWATYAPFNEIVNEICCRVNPKVRLFRLGHGGMKGSQAKEKFFEQAMAEKPAVVFFVVAYRKSADYDAVAEMSAAFRKAGARVGLFDAIHPDKDSWVNPVSDELAAAAKKGGFEILPLADKIRSHPLVDDFTCLDGIHMRPSYHKFVAVEFLRYLVGR